MPMILCTYCDHQWDGLNTGYCLVCGMSATLATQTLFERMLKEMKRVSYCGDVSVPHMFKKYNNLPFKVCVNCGCSKEWHVNATPRQGAAALRKHWLEELTLAQAIYDDTNGES